MNSKAESIKVLTSRLMRIINKHSRIEELPIRTGKNTGLTAKEIHCLNAIGQQKGINIKTIGDVLGVTKSAASQMVGKLEKKGFVKKEKALDNDKEILTYLTAEGWNAFNAHKEFHERHLETLVKQLDEFPDTQLAVTAAILAAVETVVDNRIAELFGD
ncbi:MarR family winged helix-turn-helix transcriptional regulator [Pseudodesulfovibrio tunisiensis]|uniref:MarR family winged helix-turn-helix transcriptional regulator n=1 Tax=Pseudodesulfovibrio tunisiensis TaxID=463192 RepID=UPI001FB3EE6D|nr:MarR family transcriptional regulator [Pseudodesulfovibrio tunisiensis]